MRYRRALAVTCAAVLVLATGAACARATPKRLIMFHGEGKPAGTGIIATVDIIFAPGVTSTVAYPQEYPVARPPFDHFHSAEVGTVLSYSLKVFPVEPGQTVTCLIAIDGKPVDTGKGKYPKPAICSGPPV